MSDEPATAALARAIRLLGGQTAVAREFDLTQGAVWQWLRKGLPVTPENRVLQLEKLAIQRFGTERVASEGISRHDLRPDIYPREPEVVE